ncbi:MAG TPA: xanthine dehydrogenase family protein molybdopterin-binding subunit [Acidobacteriota bacterium]|nr:xanthine dehydrogenase family protein molybdopterin-binding subunit [Acidobacteriota bacterium]
MKEGFYYLPSVLPETPEPSDELQPWDTTTVVGQSLSRVDGYERVSGTAVFPSDVRLPGMLHGCILRCPHAHARVISIDTSRAEMMQGIRAVITKDTPGADLDWYFDNGRPVGKLFDSHCRFEGEAVAGVAADTPYQARDAVKAIDVEYEVLPFVADDEEAFKEDSPPVREGGNRATGPRTYSRGDVEVGFEQADHVIEETYSTDCKLHTPLEPHGCVARWDGNELVVWESSQGVYAVQSRLANIFSLPLSQVRVIGHYVGGGFGSKLATGKFSVIASLLAKKTARPVRMFLSREETFLVVGNRPANKMRLKAGVKNDGTLTALEFEGLGSGGAYSRSGTGILDWQIRDLYKCSNVKTVLHNVFINAGEQRPMRAPGHPQCSWALEQMMDQLAETVGLDPVEFRLRNLAEVSQGRGGAPYTSNGFRQCLERGAEEFGWAESRTRSGGQGEWVRGTGMGGAVWVAGSGGPPSTAVVKYFSDGSANLNMGASDIGTGTKTVMAMVVAEELGIPVERIRIEHADTATTQFATPSGGSKTVPTEAPTVRAAAADCKRQLLEMAAEQLEVAFDDLKLDGSYAVSTTDPSKRVVLGDIPAFRRRQVVVGVGYRGPNPQRKAICPFAAQFCEVEVNRRTGEVRVLRFLGAHDSGRVMNRKTYDSQVYGGIVMGIGFGMTERRVLDKRQTGKMCNLSWHDYKIPTALDVPADMASVAIEPQDLECNNTGAKGLGEPVTVPTAGAIANAVYNAVGVRVTSTPVNPTSLLELIQQREAQDESMTQGGE